MDSFTLITIFNTAFKICLAISILSLIIAVMLFFRNDIRTIFAIRTGTAQQKSIRATNAKNEKTGSLRKTNIAMEPLSGETGVRHSGKTGKFAFPGFGKTEVDAQIRQVGSQAQSGSGTTQEMHTGDEMVTSVLYNNDTIPLDADMPVSDASFRITEDVIIIHTDEIISLY